MSRKDEPGAGDAGAQESVVDARHGSKNSPKRKPCSADQQATLERWALRAVRSALNRGLLTRPSECEACGAVVHPAAHLGDPRQPLDVTWLCGRCRHAAERKSGAS